MITSETIINAIRDAETESEGVTDRTTWTKNLNKEFVRIAKRENYAVYCKNEPKADWGEWLYDLTICSQDNSSIPNITECVLAMESEWDSSEEKIMEDFQKLLLCNSEFKVMVFYNKIDLFNSMREQIKNFIRSNGIFILACYSDYDGYTILTIKR